MLRIVITKLEHVEGVLTVAAEIVRPGFFLDEAPSPDDPLIHTPHYQRQLQYLALHLGNATLEQAAVT